jgi:hypothetical protein
MSLFDSASLVVTPNGYKEDKLYSIKPTDGSGDLVVTRATIATRVNSAGLVELVPYNLVTYSEQFDNADWSVQDATITPNSTTAPNGTLTADTFTRTANTGFLYSTNPLSLNTGSYSISVYAKANTISSFRLDLGTSGFSQGVTCVFDLSNGTAGTPVLYGSATSFIATIENVGNGWYRCSLSGNVITGNYYSELAITTSGSIYAWGAQLVQGSSAKEYFPTTDRLNVPRIDYTNGSCPSILVEPQRTNVVLYSQQFDNAYWTKQNASIVINSTTSPDGTLNASKLVEDTANSRHYINATNTIVTATQQTASIYIKAAGRTKFALSEEVATGAYASFNLANGTVLDQNGISAKITALTNGWFKCEYTINSTIFFLLRIVLLPNSYTSGGVNGTYIGDGTSGVFLYGAQLEQGSYATSYIPTVASSVTRNADVISKTGISSLIGQTEGTFLLDVNLNSRAQFTYFALAGALASSQNYLGILFGSSIIGFESVVSGSLQAGINFSNSSTGRFKIAVSYKANNYYYYVNGNLIGSDTSGTVPSCNDISLAIYGNAASINYNNIVLWKTQLTNAELAELTTL